MASLIYFGPYNDPGDTQGKHHWDNAHDSDCHNPAIVVDRAPGSWTINVTLFLRNRPLGGNIDIESPDDLSVRLYAAACGLFTTVVEAEGIVSRLLAGEGGVQPLKKWDPDHGNTPIVPAYNLGLDQPWQSEKISWTVPPYTSSVILVATLQTTQGQQSPEAPHFAQSPCAAVWLG